MRVCTNFTSVQYLHLAFSNSHGVGGKSPAELCIFFELEFSWPPWLYYDWWLPANGVNFNCDQAINGCTLYLV
jgi:hypothetical protein